MVLYFCNKCSKTFKKKYNYLVHIQRKKSCINSTDENENEDSEFGEYNVNTNENVNEIMNETKSVLETDIDSEIKKFECNYCEKEFTRKDNLKRHLFICKKNNGTVVELQEKIDLMCNKINHLEKCLYKSGKKVINNNNILQNITNNNQNNINMYFPTNTIPLGKEDISFLSNKSLVNMLRIMNIEDLHSRLIELINYNNTLENNQNVVKYKNKLYLSLELDSKTKDKIIKTNTIDELTEKYIKRNIDIIEDKISELKENNNNEILKIENKVNKYNEETDKLINCLDNSEVDDKKTRDKIKKVKSNVEKMIAENELNKLLNS
jgi:hypothetical protein